MLSSLCRLLVAQISLVLPEFLAKLVPSHKSSVPFTSSLFNSVLMSVRKHTSLIWLLHFIINQKVQVDDFSLQARYFYFTFIYLFHFETKNIQAESLMQCVVAKQLSVLNHSTLENIRFSVKSDSSYLQQFDKLAVTDSV